MKKAFVTLSVLALGLLAFQTAADFSFESSLKTAVKNIIQHKGSIVEIEYMPDMTGIKTGFNAGRGKGRNPFGNIQQQAVRSRGIVLTEDGIILMPEASGGFGNPSRFFGNINAGARQNNNQERKIKKIKVHLQNGNSARGIFIAYEPDTGIYFIKVVPEDLESPLQPLIAKAYSSPLEIGDTLAELNIGSENDDYPPVVNFNLVNQVIKSPSERALTSIGSPVSSLVFKLDGSLVGIRLSGGIYKLSSLEKYIEKVKEAAAQIGTPEHEGEEVEEEIDEEFEEDDN